jgi:hypothetical protein
VIAIEAGGGEGGNSNDNKRRCCWLSGGVEDGGRRGAGRSRFGDEGAMPESIETGESRMVVSRLGARKA